MGESLSILIVDDDQLDRMAISRALRKIDPGARLAEADSSRAALAKLESAAFDCILLDYQLPPSDGLSVLRDLRARGLSTPVIMLTGRGDEQVAVQLMKAGASDYLTKDSLVSERLEQSLRSAVRLYQAEAEADHARTESLERMRFLAEASRLLTASLDVPTIFSELTTLLVPALADWCAVDLADAGGVIQRRIEFPAGDGWAAMVAQLWAASGYSSTEPPTLVFVGKPLATPALASDRRRQPMPAGGVAALRIPIALRGKNLGVITLARRAPAAAYDTADMELASDLGQRVGVAIDNAQLYQQAREAVRLRDEFLSLASHELRTPLTSLLGYVQLLERRLRRSNAIGEREKRALQVIGEQVVRLNKMISALLDVSRLQSGQFALQEAPLALSQLVSRVIEELRLTLDEHTISLQMPPGELWVLGDELRLYQALQNLLQNAVKYSPSGGAIEVLLDQANGQAQLTIRDEGIGIPNEAMPFLFRRFYRAPNADERRISGIGLGLYVVHEIVRLHGGQIEVYSRLGQGSSFMVQLPLSDPPAEPGATADPPALAS